MECSAHGEQINRRRIATPPFYLCVTKKKKISESARRDTRCWIDRLWDGALSRKRSSGQTSQRCQHCVTICSNPACSRGNVCWPCLQGSIRAGPAGIGDENESASGRRALETICRACRIEDAMGQIHCRITQNAHLPVSLFPQARRKPYTHTQESLCPKRKSVLWSCRRRVVLKQKNTSRAGAAEALDRADSFAAAFFGLKRVFRASCKAPAESQHRHAQPLLSGDQIAHL